MAIMSMVISLGNNRNSFRIDTNDIQKFYNENYIPNGSAIAIAGDFSGKEMKSSGY